jgi:hypothetical protein
VRRRLGKAAVPVRAASSGNFARSFCYATEMELILRMSMDRGRFQIMDFGPRLKRPSSSSCFRRRRAAQTEKNQTAQNDVMPPSLTISTTAAATSEYVWFVIG